DEEARHPWIIPWGGHAGFAFAHSRGCSERGGSTPWRGTIGVPRWVGPDRDQATLPPGGTTGDIGGRPCSQRKWQPRHGRPSHAPIHPSATLIAQVAAQKRLARWKGSPPAGHVNALETKTRAGR